MESNGGDLIPVFLDWAVPLDDALNVIGGEFFASRAGNNLSNLLDGVGFGHAFAKDKPSEQPDHTVIARPVLIWTTPSASLGSGDLARKNSQGDLPNCFAGAVLQAMPANILAGNVPNVSKAHARSRWDSASSPTMYASLRIARACSSLSPGQSNTLFDGRGNSSKAGAGIAGSSNYPCNLTMAPVPPLTKSAHACMRTRRRSNTSPRK